MNKSSAAALCLALSFFPVGCKKSIPANVAAMVNNRPITYDQLDKQFQLQFSGSDKPTDNQTMMIQKLQLLNSMVDSEIMLQRAEKSGLMAVDSDVETKLNELKAPYTQEEFQKQLASRKMTMEELKTNVRRELSVQKLLNKEITSNISISDKEVEEFYTANKANFNLAEPQIHMLQIVVTPRPDPSVRNLKNDKAQTPEQAMSKIRMLESRLRSGEDFAMVAQNYSEDPTAANGGDVGFVGESALEKLSPELRKLIAALQPGQMSKIIQTQEGFRILKVVSKEPAGQRELNDPRVQQSIRETLMNRKDQLLRAAYYEVARNEASVSNQLAVSIMSGNKK